MLRIPSFLLFFSCGSLTLHAQANNDSLLVRSIYDEALGHGEAYENLRILTKEIGHRLSGSTSAAEAMDWGKSVMEAYGADRTWIMPVTVPSWTRGTIAEASSIAANGATTALHITALGGSVGTPNNAVVEAPILVVKRLDELNPESGVDAAGKIVLFNRAMDPVLINTGAAYGGAIDQTGQRRQRCSCLGRSSRARPFLDPCIGHASTHGSFAVP